MFQQFTTTSYCVFENRYAFVLFQVVTIVISKHKAGRRAEAGLSSNARESSNLPFEACLSLEIDHRSWNNIHNKTNTTYA